MKKSIVLTCFALVACILSSCGLSSNESSPLNPDNPITISVWHYYNGSVKEKFDSLVSEFNETVGMEKGVFIDALSYGDVNELADAVLAAAGKTIGAKPMPDVFAAYPDNAFRVSQITDLVDLENYFTKAELNEIHSEFLDEGRFGKDKKLRILPIAKSTENLYINKTYWDRFSTQTGAKLKDLATWEGLIKAAEAYYNTTGKSFFGIDSNANFMLLSSMQLGQDIYTYNGDRAELNFSEDIAYKIWQSYYIPYLKGYFSKTGRFSSDDAKTGSVIAYTGSTAGASYYPTEIAEGDTAIPVEGIALPYPYFENSKPYAIQQGAGMCISKSDEAHEYGAALFLKWFIDEPQNVRFAVSTAYFPVKDNSLKEDTIMRELDNANISDDIVKKSIKTTLQMFQNYSLYGNRPFTGSYDMRNLLDTHLSGQVQKDLDELNKRVSNNEDSSRMIEEFTSKKHFQEWYRQFTKEASKILNQ